MEKVYLKAFACYNIDENSRKKGSSGGVYSLIAKSILKCSGVVYAAVYNEKFGVVYKRINNEADLEASYGSKYVESILGDTFKSIRNDLDNGKKVLFVGTPCHCMGLMTFLGKEYSNLLCVDFICHGVPSKKVWCQYITGVIDRNPHISSIDMRSKAVSWLNYGFEFKNIDQSSMFEKKLDNVYLRGFLRNLYLRPSCYECRFKGLNRKTDITIGDFWGAPQLFSEEQYKYGLSALIIHSSKGLACFDEIKSNLKTFDVSEDDLILKNAALIRPTKHNSDREEFFKRFNKKENLKHIVYDLTGKNFLSKVRIRIKALFNALI